MRVLFVSSEVYPFSKSGGLGDVAGALPAALAEHGCEVLVVTPWYRTLRGAPLWIGDVDVPFSGDWTPVGVGTLERGGVRFAFVGHADFSRDRLYGYPDDARRFSLFSRSVPQVAAHVGFQPDLVHLNDWHSGYLAPLLEKAWHLPEGFPFTPTVFTVHNAAYQGESDLEQAIHWLRLPRELKESSIEHLGKANALKAGLAFSTRVNTVSPSYAEELANGENAAGLEETYRAIRHKFSGIVNGIDVSLWNPSSDETLPARFDSDDLTGKAKCKEELCRRSGLDPQRPLLALVSRLVEQKGVDLVVEAAQQLTDQGWSLYLLGTGDPDIESALRLVAEESPHVAARLGFDEELAHLVYAGADALLVPSRFEPCGLSQLIAMRYGTVPIARATGGLKDTIAPDRTGFLFLEASSEALVAACRAALQRFGGPGWRRMMREAMSLDFSWERSAAGYLALYRDAAASARGGGVA